MAHAQSDVKEPEIQGMWGILEIFIDTMVVCTITALVILVSGVYEPEVFQNHIANGLEAIDGTTLTGMAFGRVIPYGEQILAISTVLFAFATIVGWSYFGEQTAYYLGKEKGAQTYRLVYSLLTLPGCMLAPQMIWELSECIKWNDGNSQSHSLIFSWKTGTVWKKKNITHSYFFCLKVKLPSLVKTRFFLYSVSKKKSFSLE